MLKNHAFSPNFLTKVPKSTHFFQPFLTLLRSEWMRWAPLSTILTSPELAKNLFGFFEELEAGGLSDNGVEKLKSDRRWF